MLWNALITVISVFIMLKAFFFFMQIESLKTFMFLGFCGLTIEICLFEEVIT